MTKYCDEWILSPEPDADGTSCMDYVYVSPSTLQRLFGQGLGGDGYKVSMEYHFEGPNGETVTLYDWKSTSQYDGHGPSPMEFGRQTSTHEFHIGGHSKVAAARFRVWLQGYIRESV